MGFHWEGMRAVSRTDFSIFYRGCKPPKSIHICISGAKLSRKKGNGAHFPHFNLFFIRFNDWI